MPRSLQPLPPSRRRISHAAIVCFAVSAIAFVACAMGLFVNHMLTGSLAVSGTAAVGLIYLAMGLMNLGYDDEAKTVEVALTSAAAEGQPGEGQGFEDEPPEGFGDDSCPAEARPTAPQHASRVSSTRDVALSSRD